MSNKIYTELSWLLPKPENFSEQIKEIKNNPAGQGRRVLALAQHSLNMNQLQSLAGVITAARNRNADLSPLKKYKLGILSDSTTNLISPSIVGSGVRHGLNLEIVEPDYGQVMQEALDFNSRINNAHCDAVLIAHTFRNLPVTGVVLGDAASEAAAVEKCFQYIRSVRDAIKKNSGALCILQSIVRPVELQLGSLDQNVAGSNRRMVEMLNRKLADFAHQSQDLYFDVEALAEAIGLSEWNDPGQWFLGKLPFSQKYVPLYSDYLTRLISCSLGNSKKCLVLDLDNTLWGGVIGDDGLKGVKMSQGDPVGEAHLEIQRMALELKNRGVILAVCSKNEDATARLPFREHPEMILKESDIAVFQANWNDKASNLKAIAEKLNISTDALVFVDDNPAERAQVRQVLPEVAVPELPEDPSWYCRTISAAGYFDLVGFSEEDRKRASFYRANAERLESLETVGDYESYLKSLEMVLHVGPFDEIGRARISQLINKSNQFNLTTRRMSEAEVAEAEKNPDALTVQARLIDRFGDNGMISVVIAEVKDSTHWEITQWLMSCRVLKRRVEEALLQELVASLRKKGVRKLTGWYIPTEKNALVKEHYAKLGFQLVSDHQGTTTWSLDLAAFNPSELQMQIRRTL